MTKGHFLLRKFKQLGKKLDFKLTNAAYPTEVFSVLLKYRGKHNKPTHEDHTLLHFTLFQIDTHAGESSFSREQ